MDRLAAMHVFARVARLESFSAAARELRMSPAAVSRHVAQLEGHLGARLLERTTRRLSRTALGERYLIRCERILEDVEALESEVADVGGAVTGTLRVTAGVAFGQRWLAPLLPAFLAENPRISVELVLSDEFVDLIAGGIDIAVRAGALADSTLIARRLGASENVLVASPGYLDAKGAPTDLAALAGFDGLCDTNRREPQWSFRAESGWLRVKPRVRLAINHPEAIRDAAIAGLGIALLPHFAVADALESGALVELLADHARTPIPIHAVYPAHREDTPRTARFIAHLAAHFRLPAAPLARALRQDAVAES